MKKFKFTLQTVHNVRQMKQEKEELVLSEKQNEANRAAERLDELERARVDAIEKYTGKMKAGEFLSAYEMELNTNHLAALDRVIREAQADLEQKKRACAAQGEIVAAASREVKITDRLRETQQNRHRLETARQEQNALDELVSANFARQMLTIK